MEKLSSVLSQLLFQLKRSNRSLYALISLLSFCLLAYNSATLFCTHVPVSAKIPLESTAYLPEDVTGKSRKFFALQSSDKLSSVLFSAQAVGKLKTHLPILRKNRNLVVSTNGSAVTTRQHRIYSGSAQPFDVRVMEFFHPNTSDSDYSCEFRFFMTWISTKKSLGDRELFAISSLFKTHPNGCLIIASTSLDSRIGMKIFRPFLSRGLKIVAISPDFNYLFNNTPAQAWYNRLMQGTVKPGEVSLGQNLSNLLRLGLLYRFGGIYVDTDVIILKSFSGLRNVIGAQTVDLATGNWSRLNNAVMIFDAGHSLLYKFIQEFALTFDGNKWGHNGPYLVSRVVSRVRGRPGYNFTVLPPMAFYPVDWSRIGSLFEGPNSLSHSKWLVAKLRQIGSKSLAVHLWNKQSKGFEIEKGSIIQHLMRSSVLSHNSSTEEVL